MSEKKTHSKKNSLFPEQPFEEEDDESWQISYLDIITIVLGFLIILLSFSQLKEREKLSVSNLFDSSIIETEFITTPIDDIKNELEALLHKEIDNGNVVITRDLNDLRIRFNSDDFYSSGSASLKPEGVQQLSRVLLAIKQNKYTDFNIDVEGHTDSTPISTLKFPSNWELSTTRASNVVRYFNKLGIPKTRLKASGYADSQPQIVLDSLGNPLPVSNEMNRRIVVRLYYSSENSRVATTKVPSNSKSEVTANVETLAKARQPITTKQDGCEYSVQIGSFSSFSKALAYAVATSEITEMEFELYKGGNSFLVQSKRKGSRSEAEIAYKIIDATVPESFIIQQCTDGETALPTPLSYQIQLGIFRGENNATTFASQLQNKFGTIIQTKQLPSGFYEVVTNPINDLQNAQNLLKDLKEKGLPKDIFIREF